MTRATVALVVVGVGVAVALGLGRIDLYAAVVLVLVIVVGALAVAVARRADRGAVRPAVCPSCGGLSSPHAPYCKHCGYRRG